MKKLILIAAVFCLTSSVTWGQAGTESKSSSGSIYSKLGIGYPVDIAHTSARSAGLNGVSYIESNIATLTNPAHWGSTVYGLGTGGIGITSYNASEGDETVTNSSFAVKQFQLQLPVVRGKVGVSASFSPLAKKNFRTFDFKTELFEGRSGLDTLQYQIENKGNGGINRAELGIGWKINEYVSVGYAASALIMSQKDTYTAAFVNSGYRTVSYSFETSGVAWGNRFGAQFRVPNLFSDGDQLGVGVALDLPVEITADQSKVAEQIIQTIDPIDLGRGTVKMPMKLSTGVSYRPNNLLLIGAEGVFQQWSEYKNDFEAIGASTEFVDRYKMGAGLQYFPYRTGSDKFLSSFKYRLGTSYDSGHLKLQNKAINTLKFSFGLGIRSPNSGSSIDLSFEYGFRGTNSSNLIKEQIWGVNLSLNLAEIMFFRPKLK